jgi:hypothetical protein
VILRRSTWVVQAPRAVLQRLGNRGDGCPQLAAPGRHAAAHGRSLAAALPFFSKINLERTAADLVNRGFKVSLALVDYAPRT